MNIHKSQLSWCELQGYYWFWHTATFCSLFGSSRVSKKSTRQRRGPRGVPPNRVMGQLEPLSPTRTHSKKMAEPLGIRSKENRGDSKMGEKPWLLSGLCWLVYVSFKVSVWLFFSRMRSKGFSFYFGGLGVGTCSLHVAFTTASVRKRRQAPATVRNCSRWGECCKSGHFWRFQMSCNVVSCVRRGTLWHSNMFHKVSKVVLCDRRSTFASFSEDEFVSIFILQGRCFTLDKWCCELHCQGCVKWRQGANCVAGVGYCESVLLGGRSHLKKISRVCNVILRGWRSIWDTLHFALATPHSTLYTSHSTLRSRLHTLHLTLYTLHFALYTFHFSLHTLHFTLQTLHFNLHTLHLALPTLHFTLPTLHFTLRTQHFTLQTWHFTLHTLHLTLRTLHFTLYTPHSTLCTPHSTLHTLLLTLYTLHFTLHTPHSKLYTSHFTLHTSHFTLLTFHTFHSTLPKLPRLPTLPGLPTLPRLPRLPTFHTFHSTLHTLHSPLSTLHTSHSPLHTSHSLHSSLFTLHTSRVLVYTSDILLRGIRWARACCALAECDIRCRVDRICVVFAPLCLQIAKDFKKTKRKEFGHWSGHKKQ